SSECVAGVTSTRRKSAAFNSASREAISMALSSSARSGFRDRFGKASFSFVPISKMRSSRAGVVGTGLTYSSMIARRALVRNRPFVALCGARAVSSIGDQVAAVALVLLIAKNHTATAVGGLLLAESLPMLLSAHAGIVADKIEGRRLLIGVQLGQAAIFALITLWLPPYWALLALIASASWLGTILRAGTQTTLREVVPEDSLQPANALLGVALWGGMM